MTIFLRKIIIYFNQFAFNKYDLTDLFYTFLHIQFYVCDIGDYYNSRGEILLSVVSD